VQGTFTLGEHVVLDGENDGGGIDGSATSDIIIEDGTIKNCTAVNGGGVYALGAFTMNGGTVTGNTATEGGGIYSSGLFYMQDGTITQNTATTRGGGINFAGANGSLSISGSKISHNVGGAQGGGISTTNSGNTLTLTDCTIDSNSSSTYGGGVYWRRSSIEMTNSHIIDNSSQYGCGFYINGTATQPTGLLMHSGSISGNYVIDETSTGRGGGVWQSYGNLTIEDGVIEENRSNLNGGFHLENMDLIYLSDTVVVSNNSTWRSSYSNNAGGIFVNGANTVEIDATIKDHLEAPSLYILTVESLTMDGVKILGNFESSTNSGINHFRNVKTTEIRNAEIKNNTVQSGRSGLVFANATTIDIYDTLFEGNYGQSSGGALSVNTFTSSGVTIPPHTEVNIHDNVRFIDNESFSSGGSIFLDGSNEVTLNIEGENILFSSNRVTSHLAGSSSYTASGGAITSGSADQDRNLIIKGTNPNNPILFEDNTANDGEPSTFIMDPTTILKMLCSKTIQLMRMLELSTSIQPEHSAVQQLLLM